MKEGIAVAKKLVIVESPAKVKTIANYLGSEYTVKASVGHIRDLPQPSELPATMKKGPYGKFAVDVEDSFDAYYVVSPEKKKVVTELKKHLKEADELYLATDEDREGEAIAWHLLQVLKPKVPVKRMVFHEITKEAIGRALENTREINASLVDAQETRRILDRLVGYEVSPVLWRKVAAGLSAGRVQSVATRLVVERERERMRHVSAAYWDLEIDFNAENTDFTAKATHINGMRIAQGRDFTDDGKLNADVLHLDETAAVAVAETISALPKESAFVEGVEQKPYTRRPAAPFTTSTLQQEAGRKLKWNARDTMRTAQFLYENGYITYMRTDSTALSQEATRAARTQAEALFGKDFIPKTPRAYAKKSKGAQEAHEAIRPAGDHFRTPDQVAGELNASQLALYDLIWKRTLASQMTDATGTTDTLRLGMDIASEAIQKTLEQASVHVNATLSGTVISHRGFLAAYEESKDASRYDEANEEQRLPKLAVGDVVEVHEATAAGHQTTPPPRYTEASLVKAMEERGIGRPSTYAATISVIVDRGYVNKRGQALVPTWLAFSVVRLLEENLGRLVDYDFTASMEADLDRIATGETDRVEWLRSFYLGINDTAPQVTVGQGLRETVESLGDIDARAINSLDLGGGITVRVGKFGPYLEREDGKRANIPVEIAPDELDLAKAEELFVAAENDGRILGTDPATGYQIQALAGRFGPYVTEIIPEPEVNEGEEKPKKRAAKVKPRTGSLFKSMDLATITLDEALQLLALPRVLGTHPETGTEITTQNGRFGPYLKHGTDSRSLESEEQIFTLTLEAALEILAQPKVRGRAAAKPPLREFDLDPESGKKVTIKDGRFGPYITDGVTNITVPRSETVETITAERAYELLAEKRAKGPVKRKTTAKKTTAKKTTAKKPAAKKTTAKKPVAKKTTAKKAAAKES
ncbi:type I DNA topoisomerase [Gleimia sp. 6138-11-ORH1]|uniref:type I DNA topoisomerase n=1 Tax=Gleimia sp. 6138-11-ORH1 TaxID=2973937 RepID=UPI002167F9DA|nr:type I DNA topoisomerase [Gleimia sp. 6138-11-ORH1]MCS4484984.1 type I DNA topoisomerase [Gleimia sp. 6138-11-ORH1]